MFYESLRVVKLFFRGCVKSLIQNFVPACTLFCLLSVQLQASLLYFGGNYSCKWMALANEASDPGKKLRSTLICMHFY